MNREYTREWYMDRINAIHSIIPDCSLSTDMITGFCTETEEDHKESLSLMEWSDLILLICSNTVKDLEPRQQEN